jgi:hypothetical protein
MGTLKTRKSKQYLNYFKMENDTTSDRKVKKNPYIKWIALLIIFIGLTLPFHYVPSRMMIFPKDHLTFSHTFITENYIESLIERNNSANFIERLSIYQEPIVRLLIEKGIIVKNSSEENSSEGYRAGLLQKFSRKGSIFKTYKGEIILRSLDTENVSLASEKFLFSVDDNELASKLEQLQGKNIVVQFVIDHGTFPWQDERNVVTSVKESD